MHTRAAEAAKTFCQAILKQEAVSSQANERHAWQQGFYIQIAAFFWGRMCTPVDSSLSLTTFVSGHGKVSATSLLPPSLPLNFTPTLMTRWGQLPRGSIGPCTNSWLPDLSNHTPLNLFQRDRVHDTSNPLPFPSHQLPLKAA